MHVCGFCCVGSCVALTGKGDSDRGEDCLLDLFGERAEQVVVALVGWRGGQSQQVAQRVDGAVYLGLFASPGSVVAGVCADSGVDFSVQPSMLMAWAALSG